MESSTDEAPSGPNDGEVILAQNISETKSSDSPGVNDEKFSMTADSEHDAMKNSEAVAGSIFRGQSRREKKQKPPDFERRSENISGVDGQCKLGDDDIETLR